MDKLDDLKAELKAMERLAKLLHELPTEDSVVRVAAWLNEVMRTDMFKPSDAGAVATVEKLLEGLSKSELVHIQSLIAHMHHPDDEKRISIEELPSPPKDNPLAEGIKAAREAAPDAAVAPAAEPAKDQVSTQGF
jgi:hypothetical protein